MFVIADDKVNIDRRLRHVRPSSLVEQLATRRCSCSGITITVDLFLSARCLSLAFSIGTGQI